MRFIKFLVALVITVGLVYVLDNPIPLSSNTIPPIGKLMNPFTGFWQNAEIENFSNQILPINGTKEAVEVVYDERLVPHIFAKNMEDAAFAQGYVTAQHRLWQMDISTRATAGRLAEVLGANLAARDQLMRRRGLTYAAEIALETWKKNDSFKIIEKYAEGVNAYIATLEPKDYPVEFKMMNYAPEPWTPLHTAMFVKTMAMDLSLREDDIETTNTYNVFGKNAFELMFPEYNPKQAPIIPDEKKWNFTPKKLTPASGNPIGQINHRTYPKPPRFIGSNNWAVSGQKTKSGNPILCNDPHLGLTLPAIWYEVQLHTPKSNSYGVSLPGVPGIIIGFNQNIAWGITNTGHDVVDWYQIKWANDDKTKYLLDGKATDIKTRIETVKVKGSADRQDTIKYTIWGPIVYESEDSPYQDMAMRWVVHDLPQETEMNTFIGLNAAKNHNDFVRALRNFDSPAQNFVFAAKDGDIAIQPTGKFPLKNDGQGRFVQDGSLSANAWQGFIPKAQNPTIKNPSSNFVGSANQRSTTEDYPYYYHGNFDHYRGRVLHRKLATMENITAKDMMDLQNDNFSIEAEELLPLLLENLDRENLSKAQKEIVYTLEDWDYHFVKDKIAPTLYEIWADEFYESIWDEIAAYEEEMDMLYPRLWRTIELAETMPDFPFFDKVGTAKKENAKDMVNLSFQRLTEIAQERKNKDESLVWEKYKSTRINHLARIPAFTFYDVPIGGYHHALNAVQQGFGPSWRMIVELGDEVKAHGIYPGGQSGNPGSLYYNHTVNNWAEGKYYPLRFVDKPEDLKEFELFRQSFE